ncbi:hypothetical protein BCR32DRAFT_279721 [Anaeromyces robustus]|uniref:Uncharacterized protein n=1 Tax=Anaeromyces robustus TaxID=1754192 RepID=A0A1Y1X6K4_9FUNG|nr:hypothetical protein BCR32DRAFT_279721 [Anaeromyces robustus]|eukprot:ORX81421.1 hypothetical protein BCR32DRAFT_279721 [Anaeromyces robustus]
MEHFDPEILLNITRHEVYLYEPLFKYDKIKNLVNIVGNKYFSRPILSEINEDSLAVLVMESSFQEFEKKKKIFKERLKNIFDKDIFCNKENRIDHTSSNDINILLNENKNIQNFKLAPYHQSCESILCFNDNYYNNF